jgi:hypothetical protein
LPGKREAKRIIGRVGKEREQRREWGVSGGGGGVGEEGEQQRIYLKLIAECLELLPYPLDPVTLLALRQDFLARTLIHLEAVTLEFLLLLLQKC